MVGGDAPAGTRVQRSQDLRSLDMQPIGLVYDRWVNKYTEAWAAGLVDLKHDLEGNVEKVFEIYIRTTPERLWQAVTDPEARARYQFGARIQSDWAIGSSYQVEHAGAPGPLIEGENLEIEPVGDSCRLTVTHDQLREGADEHLYGGWPMILSGLETWLETGQELTTPGSLMYGGTQ